MVSPPAGTLDRSATARGVRVLPGDHLAESIEVVGHAGLAIRRDGGSPTRLHLDDALAAGLDRLELDVCSSADGALVVLHDTSLPDGRFVGDLDLADLRRADPEMLTIDEAVEHLAGRMPMLLDLKSGRAAQLLGAWFRGRRDTDAFAACTEKLPWLIELRFAAPAVERWPSYPDIGERLPQDIRQRCADTAAAGICVHHWVMSQELVEQAHDLGLHVNTWTVNNPFAARVAAEAGVDSITTDRVDLMRRALRSHPGPGPGSGTAVPLREAERIAQR